MSFLIKTPRLPATAAQEGSPVSTYREAETVPGGYGRERFVSHWLCQPYDHKTRAIGQNQSDMEISSIAAGYREGPIDFVGKIWRDGKEVTNLDFTFAEHGNPESQEFSLAGTELGPAARAIVHRGTADAATSIVANLNAKTGNPHPPYRRHCWIEWLDIDLGQGTTALPDLQVELGKNTPAVVGFPAGGFGQVGVNPFAAIYALLTSETGFGIDPGYFDTADWAAQCGALETIGVADRTGILTYCNPVFKTAQAADALLSAILTNVDGFLFADGGKFRVGWFPSQAPSPGLPEITEHDLEGAPSGASFPDWNRGASSVTVIFRDFDRHYNEVPALCSAPVNAESGIAATPLRVDRPMIHINTVDYPQAGMIAAEISAGQASTESTVTLSVQKSRAVKGDGSPLMPGDLFAWDYAPHSLDLVMRVVGRRIRAGETADLIEAIPERGQFPLPYVPPVDDRVLPTASAPGAIDPADVRLWLLPGGFTHLRQIAPLVDRVHRGIYRADLHLSTAGAAPWSVILDARFFVAKCIVGGVGISDSSATVQVVSTSVDFARFAAQDAVAQADDALCLLIGDEVCSVGAITAVSANTYDLAILRGRRDTAAAAHAAAVVGWLFRRDELATVEHVEFYRVRDGSNAYHVATATKYFKLQLFTIEEDGLAKPDDPGIALQLPDLAPDESAGYTITLTNVAHTVACAADGTVNSGQLGAGGTARTDVQVMRGATPLTAVASEPNSDQFSVTISTLNSTTATKEDADTVRCDTLTADTGTIALIINIAGAFEITQIFTLTKAKAGVTGLTGNYIETRFKRAATIPDAPTENTPADWPTAPPAANGYPLWMTSGTKTTAGTLIGSWSTPVRIDGADGAAGAVGPGLVYMGAYSAAQVYFKTAVRCDVVSHGGNYYPAAAGPSGSAGWDTPGSSGDWGAAFTNFDAVATKLLLAYDATILKTLVMGDGTTANAGLIRSSGASAFGTGTGFWLGYDGTTPKFRIGDPSGQYLSWDGSTLTLASPRITGNGLYLSSPTGMRYVDDEHVMTITGGSDNGAGYGAQIDLCGAQQPTYWGALVLAAANNVSHPSGNIRFRTASVERGTVEYDGTLRWNYDIWRGAERILTTRQGAVAAAPINAPVDANASTDASHWAGADSIDLSVLNSRLNAISTYLNTIGGKVNEVGARCNDLRDRLKVTSGHGLIAD